MIASAPRGEGYGIMPFGATNPLYARATGDRQSENIEADRATNLEADVSEMV